mgnify:CR=1 FL=1
MRCEGIVACLGRRSRRDASSRAATAAPLLRAGRAATAATTRRARSPCASRSCGARSTCASRSRGGASEVEFGFYEQRRWAELPATYVERGARARALRATVRIAGRSPARGRRS